MQNLFRLVYVALSLLIHSSLELHHFALVDKPEDSVYVAFFLETCACIEVSTVMFIVFSKNYKSCPKLINCHVFVQTGEIRSSLMITVDMMVETLW